jgi:hypothetical protein
MLYPPSSAYRSETGGLMSMLRVLTAQQSMYLTDSEPEFQLTKQFEITTRNTMSLTMYVSV